MMLSGSDFNVVQAQFLPVIIIALLLDSVIVSVWYLLGSLLNNNTMKSSARNEFYQLIGTMVLTVIIIVALGTFSGIFNTSLAGTIMSPQTISTMCSNIESTTNLNLLSSSSSYSFLSGIANNPNAFRGLCSYASAENTNPSLTSNLDYPLAASGIVMANLTNQTFANLQNLFIINAYIGYQATAKPMVGLCIQGEINPAGPCQIPVLDPVEGELVLLYINGSYAPYAGYSLPNSAISTVGNLLSLSLEVFLTELIMNSVFLYIWPFLIFVGLVLRATPFTRKIGGLFIAIAIGAVLFYPTVFALEYLNLGNGILPSLASLNPGSTASYIYGFNSITTSNITAFTNSSYTKYKYTPNFYVEPNLAQMALSDSCWPGSGTMTGPHGLLFAYGVDSGAMLLAPAKLLFDPAELLVAFLVKGTTSGVSIMSLPSMCSEYNVEQIAFQIINAYGLLGVTAYFLPILNLIITLSAILGLSGLLGGDTSLMGLERFV